MWLGVSISINNQIIRQTKTNTLERTMKKTKPKCAKVDCWLKLT